MANEVKIQKTVFNSSDFSKVVDTTFKTFTQPQAEVDTDTVEAFVDIDAEDFV